MNQFKVLFYHFIYVAQDRVSKIFPKLYWKINMGKRKKRKYAGRWRLFTPESSSWIEEKISSGQPLMITRFGGIELLLWRVFTFHAGKEDKAMKLANLHAGIFPQTEENAWKVIKEYQECSKLIDGLGVWKIEMERYYIRHYVSPDAVCFHLWALEPWFFENPWSRALKGKKVLVIHPFAASIEKQYRNRKNLFADQNVLPEFELITFQSVQTAAGEKDDRFMTWHEALEYMEEEIKKIEFDIAIIGCGAYGLPLAARVKLMGKQAIHMGGVTQMLFGIKGKRWENNPRYEKYINQYFIYPSEAETPKAADRIEGSCYWK